MNNKIYQEIYRRLIPDFEFKESICKNWLQQGKCPQCGKRELHTHAQTPWVLRCNRHNKCGAELHIKELYPDLFESFSDRFKPTKAKPTASADAFLSIARGLDTKPLKGLYTQDTFYDVDTQAGSATIRFEIADGVYWERLIDKADRFDRKAHFRGAYRGLVWQCKTVDYANAKEIWITEGVFDTLALIQNGVAAVSILSCVNYPDKWLEELRKTNPNALLVIALDADKAGKKFTKSFVRRLVEENWKASAAQPPYRLGKRTKVDWNDLHQLDRLKETDRKEYAYYGELLLARSASEKAMTIHRNKQKQVFLFDFDNRIFQFKIDLDRYEKAIRNIEDSNNGLTHEECVNRALMESGALTEIVDCKPSALYFQRNTITGESWYYFRLELPTGEVMKDTFTGNQISSASEFKKRLLSVAKGALYTGSSQQLDTLMKQLKLQRIKTVGTIDFVGYSKEYDAYIFRDVAVHNGKMIKVNEEDYFEVGGQSVKTLENSVVIGLNTDLDAYDESWMPLLWGAFGEKGLIVLGYWFGSLFAEQIRKIHKSYPFLEFVGEAGSGKSTLLMFLWRLLGRDNWEGVNPSTATLPARTRNAAQTANLPVVFLEADIDKDTKDKMKRRGMDWEETKSWYDGGVIRSRGMNTSGNQTYEPHFKGALVISQNDDIVASVAVLQRIIRVYMTRGGQTQDSRAMVDELTSIPNEALSGFALKCMMNEKGILDRYKEQQKKYAAVLASQDGLSTQRIILNYSQIMALLDALALVVGLNDEWVELALESLVQLAVEREEALRVDPLAVQEFWEVVEYLESNGCALNHSQDPTLIALNLNQVYQMAFDYRQTIAPLSEMKKLLKMGQQHKFIEVKPIYSAIHAKNNSDDRYDRKPASVRCWLFGRG
ncbi:toprim domain-containing protein [Vibrio vulnificus]|uniref:toprim domain-containing protein n=1 Tax=Vibrio vulnificus TaxID=672 RepID=UPI001029AB01|nr:toprim domain-containing protein [Vibrio vulnificus]RZP89602.1 bifunctional DNA primase/helicase [Vibrio vulnificus]RZR41904.1 bifunctional DNA primase/helicase [Vibrio vulnificus]